jgi:peroxiredoxin
MLLCGITTARAGEGDELLGKKLSEWYVADWHNSKPLKLKDLEGKVILVRWWTGNGCPLCEATAPALNELHDAYRDRGLVVLGFYHNKTSKPLVPGDVKDAVDRFKFQFPVAVDHDWKTLKDWWLGNSNRKWTSVSFLIDRKGTVRHIHPGGTYAKGDAEYRELRAKIEELLKEK